MLSFRFKAIIAVLTSTTLHVFHWITPATPASAAAVALTAIAASATAASPATPETHISAYLQSLFARTGTEAPRLAMAASQTHIAHPSLLQRWGVIGATAAAAYNDWTNTLLLQPELTIVTADGVTRIRTLEEMALTTGPSSIVHAAIVFHELSHAEWDLFIEEGAAISDRALTSALEKSLKPLLTMSAIPFYNQRLASSEVFAYYREELLSRTLQDAAEILFTSGLNPDDLSCRGAHRSGKLRDLMPDSQSYAVRIHVDSAWVQGEELDLTLNKELHRDINDALFEHSLQTLRFPSSRAELFQILARDQRVMSALLDCATPPPIR